MKPQYVDCFMLIGTVLSLNNNHRLLETGRPSINNDETVVNVSLTIQEIHFVNSQTMEVEVTLLLHKRWMDPRLGANLQTQRMAVARQIWRPKITVTKGQVRNSCAGEDAQFWRGFGDEGHVLLSERVVVRTFCTRNLQNFPFDAQMCQLKFGTYRFPMEEVKLMWSTNAVDILTGTYLMDFKLTNVTTLHEVEVRPSGNFSVLVVQIGVERYFLHYIMCTMLPCAFLILLCYMSLWIDYQNIAVRLGLSTTTSLILICVYAVTACLAAPTSYLKLLDMLVILSLAFSGFSMLQNVVASWFLYNQRLCSVKINHKLFLWMDSITKIVFPMLYVLCLSVCLYRVF